MKSFAPTTLTPTRTVLEKILNIEKYLAENPIVQVFSTTTQWTTPPHSGFPIDGLNNTNKNIAIGDVVFFSNNYMGVVTGLGEGVYFVATAQNIKGEQGPAGPAGPQGNIGPAGPQGEMGLNAGFGDIKGIVQSLPNTSAPTIEISTGGSNLAKNITFGFGIPKGNPGNDGAPGVDALVISEPYRKGRFDVDTTEQFARTLFNRQPVYGDDVLVYCVKLNPADNSEALIGAAQCKVSEVQDDNIKLTSMGYYPIPQSSGGKAGTINYSHLSFPNEAPGAPTLKELFNLLKTEYIQSILVHGTDSSGTRDFLVYQPNISFPQGASEVALIPYNDIMSAPRFFGINATDKNVIWGSQTATTIFTEGEISVVSIKLNVE